MTGSAGETLYVLTVLWLGDYRVHLELIRHSDGASVAGAIGTTEAEAWKSIARQLEILGV